MTQTDPHNTTDDLTDCRQPGDFATRYPSRAWIQIILELIYLIVILFIVSGTLIVIGTGISIARTEKVVSILYYYELPRDRQFLIWLTVALSGMVGGIAFALKWLYHSVAKYRWNQYRWLWRILVPTLSGVLAVFLGFMVVSGIVPFMNRNSFDNFLVALGFGFFVGYFSDNALAGLSKFANKTFGTASTPPSND